MTKPIARSGWLVKRKQVVVTTWKLRFLALFLAFAVLYSTYPSWLAAMGDQLVHHEKLEPAELLLLENFDTNYGVFEEARELLLEGYSSRVLVPLLGDEKDHVVERGFVDVMSRAAGIDEYEALPVDEIEPISLNVARQIADHLDKKGIRSVIVVSPRLRSARSYLVYQDQFSVRGIKIQCVPVKAGPADKRWWETWHGIQDFCLEFSKLQYYRVWVL